MEYFEQNNELIENISLYLDFRPRQYIYFDVVDGKKVLKLQLYKPRLAS